TTVLIDEFRARGNPEAPVNAVLLGNSGEELIVPAIAAGEFLDGACMVSAERFQGALQILKQRRVVAADLETAGHYGHIVSRLRKEKRLAEKSINDLWIAATARRHGANLLTRNVSDFEGIPALEVVGYTAR
ncbi:MAG: type II toxin-antitoxin system VapC family toxin, partial [Terrimicrobiaceae bacterium]